MSFFASPLLVVDSWLSLSLILLILFYFYLLWDKRIDIPATKSKTDSSRRCSIPSVSAKIPFSSARLSKSSSFQFQRLISQNDKDYTKGFDQVFTDIPTDINYINKQIFGEDCGFPSEILHLQNALRFFGHIERDLFFELCKKIVIKRYGAGKTILQYGSKSFGVCIVQSGAVSIFVKKEGGDQCLLRKLGPGEHFMSIVEILKCVSGAEMTSLNLFAVADKATQLLTIDGKIMLEVFSKFPKAQNRLMQVGLIRLHQIMASIMVKFFGFGKELYRRKVNLGTLDPKYLSQKWSYVIDKVVEKVKENKTKDSSHQMSSIPSWPAASHVSLLAQSSMVREEVLTFYDQEEELCKQAKQSLATIFELPNDCSLLDEVVSVVKYRQGEEVIKQNQSCNYLYFILIGRVVAVTEIKEGNTSSKIEVFSRSEKEFIAMSAFFTSEMSLFTYRVTEDTAFAVIGINNFARLLESMPNGLVLITQMITDRLSSFVTHFDFAMHWRKLKTGEILFRENDLASTMYVIFSGRLQATRCDKSGKHVMCRELGRDDIAGWVEMLTGQEQVFSMSAIRETDVVAISEVALEMIKITHPKVIGVLLNRLTGKLIQDASLLSGQSPSDFVHHHLLRSHDAKYHKQLKTVTLIPGASETVFNRFIEKLVLTLKGMGKCLHVNSNIVEDLLGKNALKSTGNYQLMYWLEKQEEIYDIIIYQADNQLTPWTWRTIKQADAFLIVCHGHGITQLKQFSHILAHPGLKAKKDLVLLYDNKAFTKPHTMKKLLRDREWVTSVHHIRVPSDLLNYHVYSEKHKRGSIGDPSHWMYPESPMSDLSRLSRYLTGKSIGLVLGGGGARGFAHIGAIKAFHKLGVPIDMIGGTSMGALIGGLYAKKQDIEQTFQDAKVFAKANSFWPRLIQDATLPIVSILSGRYFNSTIWQPFKDIGFQDLLLPFFCVSTDVTISRPRIHTSGTMWQYVRASMTLWGLLPPVVDTTDGHYLVDGAYVNNLPVDVMHEQGCSTVYAVDVGSGDKNDFVNYGDYISGWWILLQKMNPFSESYYIPTQGEIQTRLAYISCANKLERTKIDPNCIYLKPPVERFAALQFMAINEIESIGYNFVIGVLRNLLREKTSQGRKCKLRSEQRLDIAEHMPILNMTKMLSDIYDS